MVLSEEQADQLLREFDKLPDIADIMDPLVALGADGDSEDREDDTLTFRVHLARWVAAIAKVRTVAQSAGLRSTI
jgi:hypothetical protein